MFFKSFKHESREDLALLEDKQIQSQKSRRTAASVLNLMNYIVGAGLLALPWAFKEAGLVPSLICMVIVAIATTYSFFLLLWASDASDCHSFDSLANFCYGHKTATLIKIIMTIDSLGVLTAYILVISNAMDFIAQKAFGTEGIWASNVFILGFSLIVFVLPLCLLSDISWLGFTSLLALVPMVFLEIYQIIVVADKSQVPGTQGNMQTFGPHFFLGLPIFVWAFSSQQALFPVYSSVRGVGDSFEDQSKTIKRVVMYAVAAVGFSYTFAGLIGYAAFPETANGNILLSFPSGPATDTLSTMVGASLILTYPVALWPCRYSIDRLIYPHEGTNTTHHPYKRFALETIAILAFIFLSAVLIPSFSTLLGLLGSVTATIIGFVLPSVFYIRTRSAPFREDKHQWGAIVLLVVGSAAGAVSAVITVMEFVQDYNGDL